MPFQASILIYGNDPLLLETRRWVLERAGHRVWTAMDLSEIAALRPDQAIDLIILCHSLTMEDCGRALSLAATRWPQARSLSLIAGLSGCHLQAPNLSVDANQGPVKLLHVIETLLSSECVAQSHVA